MDSKHIYCNTVSEFVELGQSLEFAGKKNVLRTIPEQLVINHPDYPKQLGITNKGELERNLYKSGIIQELDSSMLAPPSVEIHDQLRWVSRKKCCRIAVINGLGAGVGDVIVGLTAFRYLYSVLSGACDIHFDFISTPGTYITYKQLIGFSGLSVGLRRAPLSLKDLSDYDGVYDLGGLNNRSDFDEYPMVDFYLRSYGLDPNDVKKIYKRNALPAIKSSKKIAEVIRAMRDVKPSKRLILFHPLASNTLRSVPNKAQVRILDYLESVEDYCIVSAVPVVDQRRSVYDLSKYSQSLADYISIISMVDGVLCVDTSAYHIADCFNIPSAVWFTSIPPELRVSYYPYVSGFLVGGFKKSEYFQQHFIKQSSAEADLDMFWRDLDLSSFLSKFKCVAEKRQRECKYE